MIDHPIETFSTERDGNDSILRYKLILGYEWDDLVLCLSENHNGYQGKIRESKSFILEDFEGDLLIEKIKDYVNDFADNEAERLKILERLEFVLNQRFNIDICLIKKSEDPC